MTHPDPITINDDYYDRGGLGWARGVALAVKTLSEVQEENGRAASIECLHVGGRDDVRLALIVIAGAYTQTRLDAEVAAWGAST